MLQVQVLVKRNSELIPNDFKRIKVSGFTWDAINYVYELPDGVVTYVDKTVIIVNSGGVEYIFVKQQHVK